MRESAKYQIPFLKKNWKSKFKIPEFEKKVKPGRKKSYLVEGNLYGKLLKKFLFKSYLKELVTNYRFVSSDCKVSSDSMSDTFQIRKYAVQLATILFQR